MRYAIVIEKAENNYSAYVPDLPGCVATGATVEQAEAEIREAIEFHIEGMREDGFPIPEPLSRVEYVEVRRNVALRDDQDLDEKVEHLEDLEDYYLALERIKNPEGGSLPLDDVIARLGLVYRSR